jgi:hypothetical protein
MAEFLAVGPSLGTMLLTTFLLGDVAALYALSGKPAGQAGQTLTPAQVDAQARITRALTEELAAFGLITGEVAAEEKGRLEQAAAQQTDIQKQILDALSEEVAAMSTPDLQFEIAWRKGMEKDQSLSPAITIAKRTPSVLQRDGFLVDFVQSVVDTLTRNGFNRNWKQYVGERQAAYDQMGKNIIRPFGFLQSKGYAEELALERKRAAEARRGGAEQEGGGTLSEARQMIDLALAQDQPKGAVQEGLKRLVTIATTTVPTIEVDRLYYIFDAFARFRKNSRDSVFRKTYSPARMGDAETMYDFLKDPDVKVNPAFANMGLNLGFTKIDVDTKFKEIATTAAEEAAAAEAKAARRPTEAARVAEELAKSRATQAKFATSLSDDWGEVPIPADIAAENARRALEDELAVKTGTADAATQERVRARLSALPVDNRAAEAASAAAAAAAKAAAAEAAKAAAAANTRDMELREAERNVTKLFTGLRAGSAKESDFPFVLKLPQIKSFIDTQEPDTGKTLLMYATEQLMGDAVKQLILAGANTNLVDVGRRSAFHYIARAPESRALYVKAPPQTMATTSRAFVRARGTSGLMKPSPAALAASKAAAASSPTTFGRPRGGQRRTRRHRRVTGGASDRLAIAKLLLESTLDKSIVNLVDDTGSTPIEAATSANATDVRDLFKPFKGVVVIDKVATPLPITQVPPSAQFFQLSGTPTLGPPALGIGPGPAPPPLPPLAAPLAGPPGRFGLLPPAPPAAAPPPAGRLDLLPPAPPAAAAAAAPALPALAPIAAPAPPLALPAALPALAPLAAPAPSAAPLLPAAAPALSAEEEARTADEGKRLADEMLRASLSPEDAALKEELERIARGEIQVTEETGRANVTPNSLAEAEAQAAAKAALLESATGIDESAASAPSATLEESARIVEAARKQREELAARQAALMAQLKAQSTVREGWIDPERESAVVKQAEQARAELEALRPKGGKRRRRKHKTPRRPKRRQGRRARKSTFRRRRKH